MADFYGRMQQTSQRLINKFKQGDVVYNAPGTPASPFNAGTDPTPYPVDAVEAPAKDKKTYIDGGYIVATDVLLVVSPFGIEPTQSGTMQINGDIYQIVMVDSPTVLPPSDQLVWRIGCRK